MTESMSSEELQQLIAGYILYDLSPEEAATVEQLMVDNPAIAQEVARMQQSLELAYAPSEVQPPESLRAAVLNAYSTISQSSQETASTISSVTEVPFRSVLRRGWGIGLGVAAAALILGLSISNYVLWRSLQATRAQMQTTDVLSVSLEPVEGNATTASANVAIDVDDLEATLQVQNLPPLPDGQVYVLWTVLQPDAPFTVDAKNAILTDVFTVANEGEGEETTDTIPLPRVYRDRQWIKAIAITVEAADAPQQHESSPILMTQL